MKATLIDLFTSKKFLAALTAVVVYVAGRFGFDVDTATLDRILAAILVYIGAQGIADNGKSAAAISAAAMTGPPAGLESPAVRDTPAESPRSIAAILAGRLPPVAILLLVAGLVGATQVSCATVQPRERAAAGAGALLDCEAPSIASVLLELVPLAKQAVMAAISGDGHADTAALRAAAAPLKSDLGRCALATAVAILATPQPKQPGAPAAAELVIDGIALRAEFTALRADLGWGPVKTSSGAL